VIIVASETHRVHHPREPILDAGRLVPPREVPERADRIVAALAAAEFPTPVDPIEFGLDPIRRVHTDAYLDFLEHAHERWCAAYDVGPDAEAVAYARSIRGDTYEEPRHITAQLGWYSHDCDPILAGTWSAARGAVNVTLTAWQDVADGREASAYALARPPGHHVTADSFAGFSYLNNAAIAAEAWVDRRARVAVLDVDYHHGNGTQRIFYERDDVLFVSLHADPVFEYPFFTGYAHERGTGTNCNYPLPEGTTWREYAPALNAAARDIRDFAPDGLIVSLGVDTALEDPDRFALVADDYLRMGDAIAALELPTVLVQEGGYCLDVIGRNVANVLRAFTR
jgi:acetoin utilization deacetylase AcuC-like enzyme